MLTFSDKRYTATFRLGLTTDTLDISGNILTQSDVNVTAEEIECTVNSFTGVIEQVPPMYSAIKVGGKKLCDLARKGIEIERKARNITIYNIDILDISGDEFTIDVSCSKGTYIRTLGHDIGQKLGCGATMTRLIRTQSSVFVVENSVKLDELTPENYCDYLVSPDSLFDYEKLTVEGELLKKVLNGNTVKYNNLTEGAKYRVYDDNGIFLCISRAEDGELKVEKMFYVGD